MKHETAEQKAKRLKRAFLADNIGVHLFAQRDLNALLRAEREAAAERVQFALGPITDCLSVHDQPCRCEACDYERIQTKVRAAILGKRKP